MKNVFVECCVYVRYKERHILSLGMGMESVMRFCKLADEGIAGCMDVEKGYYCNRDVTIAGNSLLSFIKKEYPEKYLKALELIEPKLIYVIVAKDLS